MGGGSRAGYHNARPGLYRSVHRNAGAGMAINKTRIISLLWGFAEATFFFIVPDVWLSRIAIQDKKEAFINIAFCIVGAILGGLVIYSLGLFIAPVILDFFDTIPAISEDMIGQVGQDIDRQGFALSLLFGMIQGIPYKLFAAWAAMAQVNIVWFIVVSVMCRGLRFFAVTLVTIGFLQIGQRWLSRATLYKIHGVLWVLFYVWYFSVMGF